MLHSPVSEALPVPDALLGLGAYLAEAALETVVLARGSHKARLALGVLVAGMALTALMLIGLQALVVGSWCSLCLGSAAISLTVAGLAARGRPPCGRRVAPPAGGMFGHDALRVGQGAMSRSSRQRVVVITGASAGIGRATAIAFAGRGDRVALLARGAAGLEGARADVERAGGIGLPLPTDVASAARWRRRRRRARQSSGRSMSGSTTRWRRCSRRWQRPPPRSSGARPRSPTSASFTAPCSAAAHAPSRPGSDRAGGLGALLPGDPAAGGRTAAPSTRSRGSPRGSAASCSMRAAASA